MKAMVKFSFNKNLNLYLANNHILKIHYVCLILPVTAFVVFHQWLKKYSKRHKYSKTDYVATKPTETDNPSPASIQPAA